ncbi:MAG: hypothetical protein R8M38_01560 [Mariprofundaceae bacterium]
MSISKKRLKEIGIPLISAMLIVISSLFAMGCGGSATTSISSTVSSTTSVQLINDSSIPIHYFYISPSSSGEWGPDQLGESTIVDPWESYTVHNIPCGDSYDLLVEDIFNDELAIRFDVFLSCSTTMRWTITD